MTSRLAISDERAHPFLKCPTFLFLTRQTKRIMWQRNITQHPLIKKKKEKSSFPLQELYPGTKDLFRNLVHSHDRNQGLNLVLTNPGSGGSTFQWVHDFLGRGCSVAALRNCHWSRVRGADSPASCRNRISSILELPTVYTEMAFVLQYGRRDERKQKTPCKTSKLFLFSLLNNVMLTNNTHLYDQASYMLIPYSC